MGQLNVVLELSRSRFTNLICIGVVFLLILSMNVNAQTDDGSCVFETNKITNESDHWVIKGESISEKTDVDEIIWEVATRNIRSSISSYHPHAKYLTGQRYSTRYVYKASSSFPEFVDTEKVTTVYRIVTFTCANGDDVIVHFQFPLDDENDPPVFLKVPEKDLRVDIGSTGVINESPIVVWDKDFNDAFNEVIVTTDRPEEFKISLEVKDPAKGIGKDYHVDLKLNLENENIKPGLYNINLFANDGQFSSSTPLRIHITSSS